MSIQADLVESALSDPRAFLSDRVTASLAARDHHSHDESLHPPALLGIRIVYHGPWFPWTTDEESVGVALPRATQTKGSNAELTFEGGGVEYVAQKTLGQGLVNVYLDGQLQSTASLDVPDFPVLFGVVVFSATGLPTGRHVIRIENQGNDRANLECFHVFPA